MYVITLFFNCFFITLKSLFRIRISITVLFIASEVSYISRVNRMNVTKLVLGNHDI